MSLRGGSSIERGGGGGVEQIDGGDPFIYTAHSVFTTPDADPAFSIWDSASATLTPTPRASTRTDINSNGTSPNSRFYTLYVNEVDGDGDTIVRNVSELYYKSLKITFDNPLPAGFVELNDAFQGDYKIFVITETFDPETLTFATLDGLSRDMIRFNLFRFLEDKQISSDEIYYYFSMDGPANTNHFSKNIYGILTSFDCSMQFDFSQQLSMTVDTASSEMWYYP